MPSGSERHPDEPLDDEPLEDELLEDLPPNLRSDLRALFVAPVEVPVEIDAAILRGAREQLVSGARTGSSPRFRATRQALFRVAALVVIALGVGVVLLPRVASGDVNQDGVVDVLDAFDLARRVERLPPGSLPAQEFDLNQDGVVDTADVRAILSRAVDLGDPVGKEAAS